ncbi:hypothetical protein FRB93_011569 [Tulasnella sp. JGI-2019a]|nr:hypothetical protein FRB93_011569 [Tulasnella sp. JGI-2019a]
MKRRNNTIAKDDASDQVETLPGPAKRVKRKAVPRTPEPTAKEGAAVIADEPVFEEVTNEAFVQQYAINLAGADVYYQPNTVDSETANRWYEELNKLDTWYHPELKVYGKTVTQSRAIAAYATTPSLIEIQAKVEEVLDVTFNHVLLNRYEDGSIYIGKHSDTPENKVIASLSLGAERTFIMTPRKGFTAETKSWPLANGSLLVMQGDTQKNWHHEIPKESKKTVKGGRISLTFRQLAAR